MFLFKFTLPIALHHCTFLQKVWNVDLQVNLRLSFLYIARISLLNLRRSFLQLLITKTDFLYLCFRKKKKQIIISFATIGNSKLKIQIYTKENKAAGIFFKCE